MANHEQLGQDVQALQTLLGRLKQNLEGVNDEDPSLVDLLSELDQTVHSLATACHVPAAGPVEPSHKPEAILGIVESITDGLLTIDRDWRLTYINHKAARNGFREPEEVIGKNVWEAFPQLLGTPLETHYRQVMAERVPVQFELKGITRATWYLVCVYPSADGVTVLWLDHSAQKQAEFTLEQLVRDNQRQAALLDGVIEADPSGLAVLVGQELRFVYVNPAYRYIIPNPILDPVGRSYDQVWPQKSQYGNRDRFREVLKTGRPFQVTGIEHSFPDGSARSFTLQARRIQWEDEPAALLILWDVTEQKKAEEALRENERCYRELAEGMEIERAKLAAVIENLPVGVGIGDASGNTLSLNAAGLMLHGFQSEAEMFSRLEQYIQEFELRYLDGRIMPIEEWPVAKALRGEFVQDYELCLRNRLSGAECVLSYNVAPIKNSGGETVLIVYVMQDRTERKQAEAEGERLLQENITQKDLLERIVQKAPVGIAVLHGPEHRFVLVNPVLRGLFPTIPEFDGRAVAEIWPEKMDVLQPLLDRVYRMGEPFSVVNARWQTDRRNGPEETYYTLSASPLPGPEGSIEGILVLSIDTTEQVLTRRAIEANQNQFNTIIQNAPHGFLVVDEQARILLANPAASRLFSHPIPLYQAYSSHTSLGLCHPDGTPYDPDDLPLTRSALYGETLTGVEMVVCRPDGANEPVLVFTGPVLDSQGKITGAVGIFQDVSWLKRTERALHESEERFRLAILNSPINIYTTDSDLRYTWMYNPPTGYQVQDFLGKTDEEIFPEEEIEGLIELKRRVLKSGIRERKEIWGRSHGRVSYHDVTVDPLVDPAGKATGLTVVAFDTTQIHKLEQEMSERASRLELQQRLLEQREQERLRIAQDLHDGPTQDMVGASLLIQALESDLAGHPAAVALQELKEALHHQLKELRAFAQELRPPTLMNFGMENAILSHLDSWQEKYPDIRVDFFCEQLEQVLPDRLLLPLFRIYQETLNNIAKHAQATQVTIQLEKNVDGRVRMTIQDNGRGIDLPLDWLTLAREGHLGLVGIRERAEAVGGLVEITSRPGAGTQVRVLVPLEKR